MGLVSGIIDPDDSLKPKALGGELGDIVTLILLATFAYERFTKKFPGSPSIISSIAL